MAYAVMTAAESQDDAEQQVAAQGEGRITILRSRQLDLSGLPPVGGRPLAKHWAVVVEHEDAAIAARMRQEDPEQECEREIRLIYLTMATDPDLLVTGVLESVDCPVCGHRTEAPLKAPRERRFPEHAQCAGCRRHLTRAASEARWFEVASSGPPICAFCFEPANSREHVIPAWVGRRLNISDFLSHEDAFIVGGERRRQPISFRSYRAKVMCADCNRHFKDLEDAVAPLIEPMARGRLLSLDVDSQRLLALWVNKTAIALMAAEPAVDTDVPRAHAEAVRAGQVAADTWIGVFSWRGSGPVLSAGRVAFGPAGTRTGYGAALAFAGFGFHLFALDQAPQADEVLDHRQRPFIQVAPEPQPHAPWPPEHPVDSPTFGALLNTMPLKRRG